MTTSKKYRDTRPGSVTERNNKLLPATKVRLAHYDPRCADWRVGDRYQSNFAWVTCPRCRRRHG